MMYDKPRGYFEKILAIDCETTGLDWNADDPSTGHQPISWGVIVANAHTLTPIEELYVEIKYNEQSKQSRAKDKTFGVGAANIHGLTFKYLEENGIEESAAVEKIANLILKYWGPINKIHVLAHNANFDKCFLRTMFRRVGIELPFSARTYDTNAAGYLTTGAYISDALFETMGFANRNAHNSMEDIKMTLESARIIKSLWETEVGLMAYE